MSSGSHIPPSSSTFLTSCGEEEGLREVAITLCPALRTRRARDLPKPAEQPVMSQTSGGEGVVDAIFAGWGWFVTGGRVVCLVA